MGRSCHSIIAASLVTVTALAWGAAIEAPPPSAVWHVARTPDYTVLGTGGAADTGRVAAELDEFHAVLAAFLPRLDASAGRDVVVFAFDSRATLRRYWPTLPQRANGVFVATSLADYMLLDIGSAAGYGPLFHEYVHRVVRDRVGPLPAWLNEGLAYYFQTWRPADADGHPTVAVGGKVAGLADRLSLSLDVLFAIDASSPEYATKRFVSSARAVTRYVMGQAAADPLQLADMLERLRNGESSARVLTEQCACTLDELATSITTSIRASEPHSSRLPARVQPASDDREGQPLERGELLVHLGEMLRAAAGDTESARTMFEAALLEAELIEAPGASRALAGLALVEYARGNLERAEELAGKAVRADPDDPRAWFARGQVAMGVFAAWRDRRSADAAQERPPQLLAARAAYRRTVALEPVWSAALNGYARTFLFDPVTRQPGIAACEARLRKTPDAALALTLVQLYSEDGNPAAAHMARRRWFPAGRPLPGPHDLQSGALAEERIALALAQADMLLAERLHESARTTAALELVLAVRQTAPATLWPQIDEQIARFERAEVDRAP